MKKLMMIAVLMGFVFAGTDWQASLQQVSGNKVVNPPYLQSGLKVQQKTGQPTLNVTIRDVQFTFPQVSSFTNYDFDPMVLQPNDRITLNALTSSNVNIIWYSLP